MVRYFSTISHKVVKQQQQVATSQQQRHILASYPTGGHNNRRREETTTNHTTPTTSSGSSAVGTTTGGPTTTGGVAVGYVVRYDRKKGFGFISPTSGGPDIFFHKRVINFTQTVKLPPSDFTTTVDTTSSSGTGSSGSTGGGIGGGIGGGTGGFIDFGVGDCVRYIVEDTHAVNRPAVVWAQLCKP
eukprot:GHVS01031427.1.p1 GENE.GHVS01031427.1~~GHVS01031427.1.p1  ORF type:complete len:186 (-),score=71.74 GHVS01031427.1:279-836(-)